MTPRTAWTLWTRTLAALFLAAMLAPAAFSAEEKKEPKDLADHMSIINDNYKKLNRSARNKSFDDASVKLATQMVEEAKICKEMVPPMAEKISDAKKKQEMIDGYKKEMDGLIAELVKLETALKEKKTDDAVKIITGLNALKKAGHDKYVEE